MGRRFFDNYPSAYPGRIIEILFNTEFLNDPLYSRFSNKLRLMISC